MLAEGVTDGVADVKDTISIKSIIVPFREPRSCMPGRNERLPQERLLFVEMLAFHPCGGIVGTRYIASLQFPRKDGKPDVSVIAIS
jgi:hypothetical protein